MKIGILTLYYNNENYGGLLQAFALQRFLTEQGYECEQICWDFKNAILQHSDCSNIRNIKRLNGQKVNAFQKIEKKIATYIYSGQRNMRIKSFKNFEKTIQHSKLLYACNNFQNIAQEYDAIVVGSDQIWNMEWYCPEHFIDFKGDVLKIAYAASMPNTDLSNMQKAIITKHLQSFTAISVREKGTQELLKKITKQEISLMPDPTLILEKEDWKNLMLSDHKIKDPYIFCYFLGGSKDNRKLAKKISKMIGENIVTLPHLTEVQLSDCFWGDKKLYDVSPGGFLKLIYDADLVITDSFHATVFSIIFQTKFITLPRNDNDKSSSRIDTLLTMFGLREHMISDSIKNEDTLFKIINEKIEDKSPELKKIRKHAEEFFEENLERC